MAATARSVAEEPHPVGHPGRWLANARGADVLDLASTCAHTLTATIDDAGLRPLPPPSPSTAANTPPSNPAAAVEQFRIINVDAGDDLTLNHLTITSGHTDGDGIYRAGVTTVRHTTVSRHSATARGGGY